MSIYMFLPLALASAVAPGCFMLMLRKLAAPHQPGTNGLAYLCGALLANCAVVVAVVLLLDWSLPVHPHVRQPHFVLRSLGGQ